MAQLFLSLVFLGLPASSTATPPGDQLAGFRPPPVFIENQGQWSTPARFVARGGGLAAGIGPDRLHLRLEERSAGRRRALGLALVFEGARQDLVPLGEETRGGLQSFFLGNDPARWRANLPGYSSVLLPGIQDCVEVRVHAGGSRPGNWLEYDFLVGPGIDPAGLTVRAEGVEGLEIDADGSLVLLTPLGVLRQPPPRVWQEEPGGGRRGLECRYRILGPSRFGFELEALDPELALVIDPQLEWSTYLGGGGEDVITALAIDAKSGDLIVGGYADSTQIDFPVPGSCFDDTQNGGFDAFVSRLEPQGDEVVCTTFLGGIGDDGIARLVLDASGSAHLVGFAGEGFPTSADAFQPDYHGATDAFIAKLRIDPLLTAEKQLAYSTFLGGEGDDGAVDVGLDPAGMVIVAGYAKSLDFPVHPDAVQPQNNGGYDGFVVRLDLSKPPDEQFLYSTLLGGRYNEINRGSRQTFNTEYNANSYRTFVKSLAILGPGEVVFSSTTSSDDFPTTDGAIAQALSNAADAPQDDIFVARLKLDAELAPVGIDGQLIYSTYLGGESDDNLRAVSVDSLGVVMLLGNTYSTAPNFPSKSVPMDPSRAFQAEHGPTGFNDAFVIRMRPDPLLPPEEQIVYATYAVGVEQDGFFDGVVDGSGRLILAGRTRSPDYPVTDQSTFQGTSDVSGDAILTILDPSLPPADQLIYSTLLGGPGFDTALALAPDGEAIIAGMSEQDFPTTPGAFDETYNSGLRDGFVARIRLPQGSPVKAVFTATPERGPAPLQVAFDASGSRAEGGTFDWDFGDGQSAVGAKVTNTFADPGQYLVTLTVTDNQGLQASVSHTVLVACPSGAIDPWKESLAGTPPPVFPGGATLANGTLTLCAGGAGLRANNDKLHFVYRELPGDGDLTVRLQELTRFPTGSVLGVMVRAGLNGGDALGALVHRPSSTFQFLHRPTKGAVLKPPTSLTRSAVPPKVWMRIERKGTTITGKVSLDSAEGPWDEVGQADLQIPPEATTLLAGVFVSTGSDLEPGVKFEPAIARVVPSISQGPLFRRGDGDASGSIDLSDPINLLNYLFLGGALPECLDAADFDDSGIADISDAVVSLDYQFLGGPPPAPPVPPDCGPDADLEAPDLGCRVSCP